MERREILQAGFLAAAGTVATACGHKVPPDVTPTTPMLEPPMGSLPGVFSLGGRRGLQLFFHGMCSFVLPSAPGDPLRVAMLKGYPADKEHEHRAVLLVPRGGVDVNASTTHPSGVDGNHIIYSLEDMYVTVAVADLKTPVLKVNNTPVGLCPTLHGADWNSMGWVLKMSDLSKGEPLDWGQVGNVSQAQFETAHGSVEQDFEGTDQLSPRDNRKWRVNGKSRALKQTVRLRIKDAGPISLVLKSRSNGSQSTIVLLTKSQTINAGILNLPLQKKSFEKNGSRLEDVLAYYQMMDPSPLGKGNDDKLPVPLWDDDPACNIDNSPECGCCPPSA
ncbi:MAG TPA: hypothetical protein VGH34_16765 [Vicinamibacterales bacterium]